MTDAAYFYENYSDVGTYIIYIGTYRDLIF